MRVPPFAIGSIYIRQQGLPEYATSLSTPIRTDVSVIDKWDQAIKVHLVNTSTGTKVFWPWWISSVFHYQIKSAHWFLIGCSNISFLIGCQVFWPARVYSTPKQNYREKLVEKSYRWRLCPSEPSGPQCSYLRPESDVKVAISGNLSENIPRQGPSAHLAHGYSSNKTERSISLKVLI